MNSVWFVWQRKQSRAKGCNTEQTDDASVSHVMFNRHRFHSSALRILHFVRCLLPPLISLLISSSSPLRVDKVRNLSAFTSFFLFLWALFGFYFLLFVFLRLWLCSSPLLVSLVFNLILSVFLQSCFSVFARFLRFVWTVLFSYWKYYPRLFFHSTCHYSGSMILFLILSKIQKHCKDTPDSFHKTVGNVTQRRNRDCLPSK